MTTGITGHQELGEFNLEWIKTSLVEVIHDYKVTRGISSLAKGADQLFVEILLEQHMPFDFISPSDKYDTTFNNESDYLKFKRLNQLADAVTNLAFKEPGEEAFYAAGREVVNRSELIIAVWDGKKAKGLGGTGDIVQYAIQGKKKVVHINPITATKMILNA